MYPSDLGDAERQLIEPFFNDRIRVAVQVNMLNAAIINAILYVIYGGIQWRILPKEFPPWGTIYDHFRRLNQSGIWQQILDAFTQQSRRRQGRHLHPPYAIIDSQSVKMQ